MLENSIIRKEMDKYQVYFSRTTKEKYGAFSKARNDVSEILFRKGYKRIGIVSFQNYPFLIRQLVGSIYALFVLLKLPKGSVCLFQYLFDTYYRYLVFPIIRKRIKMVTIIHEIVSCRMQDGKLDKEMNFLSSFEKVVAHTDKMKQLLMENGISSSKIIVLWLFDYLVNKTPDFISYPDNSVCFAGSLRKSLFLKDPHLGELNKIQFFLYGQSAELNFWYA